MGYGLPLPPYVTSVRSASVGAERSRPSQQEFLHHAVLIVD